MRAEVVDATEALARELAPRVREVEAREIEAASRYTSVGVLLYGLDHSSAARALVIDGVVACMWGVTPWRRSALAGRVGIVWMASSALIERHARTFWRLCRPELVRLFEGYDELVSVVDVQHTKSVRWLKRLGFELGPPERFGAAGELHRWFIVRTEDL